MAAVEVCCAAQANSSTHTHYGRARAGEQDNYGRFFLCGALVPSLLRRYASLYFVACIGKEDNELIALETVHAFVEVLDQYFDNVCELDIIFNFHKAYHILDEMILAGEVVETNKRTVRNAVRAQDELAAAAREGGVAGAAAASGLVPVAGGSR